jgi:cullin-4
MLMIRNIFLYLDRTFVLQTSNLKSVWDMGLHLFRETILGDQEILAKTINAVLSKINEERFTSFIV